MEEANAISKVVIGAAIRIHQKLGPGLLESVYESILAKDLVRLGFHVERQKAITFEFEGVEFEDSFRPDLVVDGLLIIEVKARDNLHPVFKRQLLTYQKIMNIRLGLLLNFGMETMKDGITRMIN